MSQNKVLGILSAPSVGGVDYQLNKFTFKVEQEKIEYVPMGEGGWKMTIPGGAMVASGSFEGAADVTLNGLWAMPTNGQYVAIACPVGSVTLSIPNAVIFDVEGDKSSTGLVTVKGTWQSSGAVTIG